MKRKAMALILVLALCLGLMPVAFAAEVQSAPQNNDGQYGAAVESCLDKNNSDGLTGVECINHDHEKYMNGYADGTFRPNAPLTRAELAQMLYAVLEERPEQLASFADVPETAWYYRAAGTLGALRVMDGDGDTFRGDQPVTRAECAVVLARMPRPEICLDAPRRTFDDVAETHWAYAEISQAAACGLFVGDEMGNFFPDRALTRAEAVIVFNRLLGRGADEAELSSRRDLRVFPDVPRDFWAYSEIMEATVTHVGIPDEGGRENWVAAITERTALSDGYHAIGGHVYYVADGMILRAAAGETCADPNGCHLVYDENGRAKATLPDGCYIMNGSVYRVKDGMFLYNTSDGYLTYDAYGRVTAASNPVGLILQNPQLPNGCEVTSLAMALASAGSPVDKMTLYRDYLPKAGLYYQESLCYGSDPEDFYVGNAASRCGGWYCFEGPIVQAGNAWLAGCGNNLRAVSVTGLSQGDLDVYAEAGIPVVVWVTLNYAEPRLGTSSWQLADGTVYCPYSNLHCVVVTGLSGMGYQIADPINGMRTVGRDTFWDSFSAMGSRAVMIAA